MNKTEIKFILENEETEVLKELEESAWDEFIETKNPNGIEIYEYIIDELKRRNRKC